MNAITVNNQRSDACGAAAAIDQSRVEHDPAIPNLHWRGILAPELLKHDIYYELLDREIGQSRDLTMLDVGCGLTNSPRVEKMAELSKRLGQFWGVEPDTSGEVPSHYGRVWRSTLETADVPSNSVDLLGSYFVVEHVTQPDEFLNDVLRVLKPGGLAISATVNLNCLFARVAKTCQDWEIQDQVLRLVRGRERVEEYHYPAYYRLNTLSKIAQQISNHPSIAEVQLIYLENDEWFYYLPRPLRFMGKPLRGMLHRRPTNYTYLFISIRKRPEA